MSRQEYLKLLEKELQRVNKIIDYKILHGLEYRNEARDHKMLLRKVRQNNHRSFLNKMFPTLSFF